MARFQLNPKKANNYAFFCPVSRLHLTVSNPVGSASEVTPAILRGVRSGSLIDIDNAVNGSKEEQKSSEPQPQQNVPVQEPEPAKSSKRGKKKEQQAVAEEAAESPVTENPATEAPTE